MPSPLSYRQAAHQLLMPGTIISGSTSALHTPCHTHARARAHTHTHTYTHTILSGSTRTLHMLWGARNSQVNTC
jgi:hypothetical protein